MKVLVTGGIGYIGSHTVVCLLEQGYEVVIADNLSNSHGFILEHIVEIAGKKPSFYQINICDEEALDLLFEKEKNIEAVIHFAAYKAVGESVLDPLKYYKNNINGLVTLLQVMQKRHCFKIVFSSSCSVYGNTQVLPVTEETPFMLAESPYGNTKQIGEEILKDVSLTSNLHAIALRYFNPVGAHQSGLLGELPIGVPNNLIPVITQSAAGLRGNITVYGNDYDTIDGTCIRDYIHVIDIAEAHVKAIEWNDFEKQNFEIFNLGSGTGTSVLQAINAFEKATGLKLNYNIGPRREGDVEKIWSDCLKSNQKLGWKTKLTIEDAMLSSWNWQKLIPIYAKKHQITFK